MIDLRIYKLIVYLKQVIFTCIQYVFFCVYVCPITWSQIGTTTGRYLRRCRSATKSRAPRCRAAGARKRPCVRPPVADRSSGRLGTIRLNGALGEPSDTRGRSNVSFAFPTTLRRVRFSNRYIETRKHREKESSSAHHGPKRPVNRGYVLAPGNERTSERTTVRARTRARRSRRRTILFFSISSTHGVLLIRTQHCHGSVSRDRMAHMWRAHSVGRAILRRS